MKVQNETKVKCAICGEEIQGFRVFDDEKVICLTCFVKKHKREIEDKLGVIIFDRKNVPFDELCHNCGSRMDWWSEVKANARYVYLTCPKCGARRVHVSKA